MSELDRQRLKEARKAAGLTQDEAGAAIGASRSFLSDIEQGKKTGSLPTIAALAKLYDVSLDFLCGLSSLPKGQGQQDSIHQPDEVRLLSIWRKLDESERLAIMSDLALRLASFGQSAVIISHDKPPKASSDNG